MRLGVRYSSSVVFGFLELRRAGRKASCGMPTNRGKAIDMRAKTKVIIIGLPGLAVVLFFVWRMLWSLHIAPSIPCSISEL